MGANFYAVRDASAERVNNDERQIGAEIDYVAAEQRVVLRTRGAGLPAGIKNFRAYDRRGGHDYRRRINGAGFSRLDAVQRVINHSRRRTDGKRQGQGIVCVNAAGNGEQRVFSKPRAAYVIGPTWSRIAEKELRAGLQIQPVRNIGPLARKLGRIW